MITDDDNIFSDSFVSDRHRKFGSIEEIQADASNPEGQEERWQKNTRKKTRNGPENKVKDKIRLHLKAVYHAKILRTNAGSIVDQSGHTIWLGETGQSDIHALIPLEIDGFKFGFFAAFEIKAKKPSAKMLSDIESIKDRRIKNQALYIKQIREKGGIACFADCVDDVDEVILQKIIEFQVWFTTRNVPT